MSHALLWFTQDLRLDDNPLLHDLNHHQAVTCVYFMEPQWRSVNRFQCRSLGKHRQQFLLDSLHDLARQLEQLGQTLWIIEADPQAFLSPLIAHGNLTDVYACQSVGYNEQQRWQRLSRAYPLIKFHSLRGPGLWQDNDLPLALNELPASFSAFRRRVEKLPVPTPIAAPSTLPKSHAALARWLQDNAPLCRPKRSEKTFVCGGESAGQAHLTAYFADDKALSYKHTRNELDDFTSSTKFSPWLANGSLSPRRIVEQLKAFEARQCANESTYWIFFELLWREYFQLYARHWGARLFAFRGIKKHAPLTTFYPERLAQWINGTTPYPLVNACMNQLRATGYISNRGRQLVASCLVHELQMDWRYGAAYFEQELIDYDVASNWGNWQYLAGVGADPRGHRHFDLTKQAALYDPLQQFTQRWRGAEHCLPLDATDAADWPLGID
ncbi:MAG: DASH family cryptochrome [Gammaproteobacteria bacterium]|nr:DASH family cryptochrome [Gammaproteobacteria bacterium]